MISAKYDEKLTRTDEGPHQRLLVALREQKLGNMLDFRKLQPAIFSSMEDPWMHSSG